MHIVVHVFGTVGDSPDAEKLTLRGLHCLLYTSEAKRQMQEYGIIKQNVDGILRTTPGKEQMQER